MEIELTYSEAVVVSPEKAIITLSEKGGERKITVSLNTVSFHCLRWAVENEGTIAPRIYGFAEELVYALSANIQKLVICDINSDDGIYRAYIVLDDNRANLEYKIPIHITDGIILAASIHCPIFILEETLEKVPRMIAEDKQRQLLRSLDNIDPDKLTKH